jgi:hypothetical protein
METERNHEVLDLQIISYMNFALRKICIVQK